MVKTAPAMWKVWVQYLGGEDNLEEGMATHYSILAWRIPMDRGAWKSTVQRGHKESDAWATKHSTAHTLTYIYTHTKKISHVKVSE